jgi:phosphoglycerol transferase
MPISEPYSPVQAPVKRPADVRVFSLETWKNAGGYAATLFVVLAAMTATLHLHRADLRVPFAYRDDNLMAQMFIQNVIESGWVMDGPRLGAPGGQNLRDFPLPDVFHLAIIKFMGWLFHDSGLVLNLYYLLGFPATALSSYFVLRRFQLGRMAALTAAVLYACLPYHYGRMGGHLFLAAYYLLPLVIWLIVRVYLGRYPFLRADDDGKPRWRFASHDAAGAVLICVLTGLAGVYYAFFSCFFLLAVGGKAALRERRWTPLIVSALLILLISAAVGTTLAPNLIYQARYGANSAVAARLPGEADSYGLSVIEMLAPIEGHRIAAFQRLRERFLLPPRWISGEFWSVPLGVTGSLGLLYLLGRFLWRRRDKIERTSDALAYLTVVALLFGAVGGLGSCFSLYVTPMIRCYERVSVFVAFFALAALFLLLHRLVSRYDRNIWTHLVAFTCFSTVLVLGVLDQTSPLSSTIYAESKREYQSDADFGRRMEAALPPGALVYEMPYFEFPEAGKLVEKLADYQLLRPYLHTRTLRFSYGAMKNRAASDRTALIAAKPLPEALEMLALAGFRGVYLDRAGYADAGASTEAELARLLSAAPMVSQSGRQVFFDMTSYVSALQTQYTDAVWEAKSETASHPLELEWTGAHGQETDPKEGAFRWCKAKAQLNIRNLLNRPRRVVLNMNVVGWQDKPVRLVLGGDLCRREMSIGTAWQPLELELLVPPGDHFLTFACDGLRMPTTHDPRELVFRVGNFEYRIEGE